MTDANLEKVFAIVWFVMGALIVTGVVPLPDDPSSLIVFCLCALMSKAHRIMARLYEEKGHEEHPDSIS